MSTGVCSGQDWGGRRESRSPSTTPARSPPPFLPVMPTPSASHHSHPLSLHALLSLPSRHFHISPPLPSPQAGLPPSQPLHVRMTGCPNGCVRPYMAELGLVGDGPNSYQLWLGGGPAQTRLAQPYAERCGGRGRACSPCGAAVGRQWGAGPRYSSCLLPAATLDLVWASTSEATLSRFSFPITHRVKVKDLESTLEPLFGAWRAGRQPDEAFGDWVARLGFDAVRQQAAAAAAAAPVGTA